MIPTLRFVKKELLPIIGPIEVNSGYRSKEYNKLAGGVKNSKHLSFCALDLKPVEDMSLKDMQKKLLKLWKKRGKRYQLGLGLYSGKFFHIDTCGYRKWRGR